MEVILLELLHRIARSHDLVSINIAAGMAYQQLMALTAQDTNPEDTQARA